MEAERLVILDRGRGRTAIGIVREARVRKEGMGKVF